MVRTGFIHTLLLALLGLIAVSSGWANAADTAKAPTAPLRISDDIYVFPGDVSAPTAANLGRVANVGVIVGSEGVVVIGTGTSDADGERLLEAIGRISAQPIVLAVNAYAGPEHVLGNSAFARHGIPILAHRETDKYMSIRCDACLRSVQVLVGDAALAGSHLERPRRLIDGPISIMAGGRRLELLYYGPTQQPGSVAVFDPASGVLFAGGFASFEVIPEVREADLFGWMRALREMRRLPLKYVVPARGAPADPARLDEVRDYLDDLLRVTKLAYDAGMDLAEAAAAANLPRYGAWVQYPLTHPKNVSSVFMQLEALELSSQRK